MPLQFMIDIEGTTLSSDEEELLKHSNVGAVILFTRNFNNPGQLKQLIKQIRQTNPNIFVAIDHEGGYVQRFVRQGFHALPAASVYGETYNLNKDVGIQLAEKYGSIMAKDLLDHGIDLSLAPVLDLHDPICPVIAGLDRAFHADPAAVTALAGAFIKGMNQEGMPATGKHFPGHGFIPSDSHIAMPTSDASLDELKKRDLRPFSELNEQGLLAAVMPAHVTFKKVDAEKPAGFSTFWLHEILRKQMQFTGMVLSDCLSMKGADIGNLQQRAEEALKAGCDMLIVCHQSRELVNELLAAITLEQSPESLTRIQAFKKQMLRFASNKETMRFFPAPTLEQEKKPVSKNEDLNTTISV